MNFLAILQPVFALASWTGLVLILLGATRVRAGLKGQIAPADFALGESKNVPPQVSLPNRNYMNLLELPVLFYVVCLILLVTGGTTPATLTLAWSYVGLRVIHSLIHLTYNHVMHRLTAFALSNLTLIALWILTGIGLGSATH